MKLDLKVLLTAVMLSDYDDPEFLDGMPSEEVDIRELRRRCRYSHHRCPAECRNQVSHGRAPPYTPSIFYRRDSSVVQFRTALVQKVQVPHAFVSFRAYAVQRFRCQVGRNHAAS